MLVTISIQYWCIIKVYDLSRFPEFLANRSSFLFRTPLKARICIQLSGLLVLFLVVAAPPDYLVCDDLGSFEVCWSGMLWDAPQLEFVLCFLLFILEWWAFGRSHRPSALLITSREGHVKSAWLHCLDLNHLAKVMLDRFLCWKLILSSMFPYCGLWGRKPLCVANRQVEGSYAPTHEGRVSIVHMLLEILLHRSVSFI